jgi:hypothetical protein
MHMCECFAPHAIARCKRCHAGTSTGETRDKAVAGIVVLPGDFSHGIRPVFRNLERHS